MTEVILGAIIGPFTIVEALPAGHGGMARVFIATVSASAALRAAGANPASQLSAGNVDALPEKVALKIARVITPGESTASEQAFYFEALNNEVETLKRLRHPNIVRLYPIPRGLPRNPYAARATELDGNPWFCAMEYLGGGSLDARIKALGALPLAEAMEIAYQVGLALDHVHAKGMAHLDVKPENVLFRWPLGIGREAPLHRIQPVLIDFGIAAKTQKTGAQAGSLAFMPPERVRVMRGEVAPEHFGDQSKVDVYGLGVLLYRMLTGKLPYEGLPREELTDAILNTRPRPPREMNANVPAKVDEIVMDALEKEPARRPRVEELITRLDEAMIARPSAPPKARPLPRLSPLAPLAGFLALALALCSLISVVEFGLLVKDIIANRPPTLTPTMVIIDSTRAIEPSPESVIATATLVATPTLLPATPTRTPFPVSP